ncbi:MAG TPA: hypothetical protein VMR73_01940 [Candidatus Paceibacterota bacterium]|nr:hypothetical protein [Candidatus Paceibacterota bacterium]
MARIVEKNSRIDLFLIGEVNTPLQENGNSEGTLHDGMPLIYTLVRLRPGTIEPEFEYILGLSISGVVLPTFSERVESLSSLENDVRQVIKDNSLRSQIAKLPFHERKTKESFREVRRIAILVPTKVIREMKFSIEDGIGIPIERSSVLKMYADEKAESKRREKAMKRYGKYTFTLPQNSINSKGVNIGFQADEGLLKFLAEAVTTFGCRLKKQRLVALRKASKMMIRF